MRRLLLLVAGGLAIVTGFRVLTNPDCNTVSFDGQGGRIAVLVCAPDDSGALPGNATGAVMLVLGIAVAGTALRRR